MHGPHHVPGSGLQASQEPPVSLALGCVVARTPGRPGKASSGHWLARPSSASRIHPLRNATDTPKPTVLPPDHSSSQTHVSVGSPSPWAPLSPRPRESPSGILCFTFFSLLQKSSFSCRLCPPPPRHRVLPAGAAGSPARRAHGSCSKDPARRAGVGREVLVKAAGPWRRPGLTAPPLPISGPRQLPGNQGQGQDRQLLHHGAQAWPPPGAPPKI